MQTCIQFITLKYSIGILIIIIHLINITNRQFACVPRAIASKQLNSWTTIDILKHPPWMQEVPGSIPGSGKGFYV